MGRKLLQKSHRSSELDRVAADFSGRTLHASSRRFEQQLRTLTATRARTETLDDQVPQPTNISMATAANRRVKWVIEKPK